MNNEFDAVLNWGRWGGNEGKGGVRVVFRVGKRRGEEWEEEEEENLVEDLYVALVARVRWLRGGAQP